MKAFIVWNGDKSEGFVTSDKGLSYEVRKSASTNCSTKEGRHSPVAELFCKEWYMDSCTIEEIETEEVSPEDVRAYQEIRTSERDENREIKRQEKEEKDKFEKQLYLNAVCGISPPIRVTEHMTSRGYMRYTGNQHNESWSWNRSFLETKSLGDIITLYKRLTVEKV